MVMITISGGLLNLSEHTQLEEPLNLHVFGTHLFQRHNIFLILLQQTESMSN